MQCKNWYKVIYRLQLGSRSLFQLVINYLLLEPAFLLHLPLFQYSVEFVALLKSLYAKRQTHWMHFLCERSVDVNLHVQLNPRMTSLYGWRSSIGTSYQKERAINVHYLFGSESLFERGCKKREKTGCCGWVMCVECHEDAPNEMVWFLTNVNLNKKNEAAKKPCWWTSKTALCKTMWGI